MKAVTPQISTQKLYRPVGFKEMQLILDADGSGFPPRLPEQPIFYPVLNFDYAAEIARKWNTKDVNSGYVGFVTAFEVQRPYVDQFDVRQVGTAHHQELWVPAEALADFNAQIVGRIQMIAAYYGDQYTAPPITTDLDQRDVIYLNFPYWRAHRDDQDELQAIANSWREKYPDLPLYDSE